MELKMKKTERAKKEPAETPTETEKPSKVKKKAEVLKVEVPQYHTYEDYPIEDLLVYGGIDCLVTSELLSRLSKTVFEEKPYIEVSRTSSKTIKKTPVVLMSIAESYTKYTAEAHEFILDLEMNGIKYDVELNKVFKARLESEIAELESLIFREMGTTFNLDSGTQLADFLYNQLGLVTTRTTKSGELSTDGDTIKELAGQYPDRASWLSPLAKRNDLSSIYRTFVATYIGDFVKRDGRVHASYSLHGTGSFRIAGNLPNLTQVPRPKHGYNLRRLFKVDDGKVFFCFDFSSAEVKILGALCKDPELLRAIEQGLDFHSLSASKMYDISYDTFVGALDDKANPLHRDYKEKRQFSKALTSTKKYVSAVL